ncbi:MAG: DnaJ domain-containing protein [Acidobacteriota bacterium]
MAARQGSLGPGGAAELLVELWKQGRTGLLELDAGGVQRRFVLRDGELVYVTSSERREKLAIALVSRGLVSKDVMVECNRAGGDLRAALAEKGGLPASDHDSVLRQLISEAVSRVFPEQEGEFSLVDRESLDLPGILANNPMVPCFWRAARALEPDACRSLLGQDSAAVNRVGGDDLLTELADMSPADGFLLSRVDGLTSVAELLMQCPTGGDHALSLLAGWTCVGLVEPTGRAKLTLPKPAPGTARPKARPKPKPAIKKPAPAPLVEAEPEPEPVEAVTDGHPLPSESEDPLAAARELQDQLVEADHYQVLGIESDADDGTVRRAYYRLARGCHPDRFGKDLAGDDRHVVELLFAQVSDAFAVLSDPKQREEYDQRLEEGNVVEEEEGPQDPREIARDSYQKGRTLLNVGERERALVFFEHCVEMEQDNWEYRMSLARCLMADTRSRRKAESHLREAIRIDETKAESYYLLGLVYKSAGVKGKAVAEFRKGLSWDATHDGIRKELAEAGGGGGGADESGGGFLGSLFGRK